MDDDNLTKDRAKARWSILRNALLQKAQSSPVPSLLHSIHRFPGYQLLERRPGNSNGSTILSQLKYFRWNDEHSHQENLDRLSCVCLGVAALSPKGQCVTIVGCPPPETWILPVKEKCSHSVSLLVVEDKNPDEVKLLAQEISSTSKYSVYQYVLDSRCSIYTREPQESRRLSLEDLVSHRKTGVDNTGNVCVWDSERSLAHLLYHYYRDIQYLHQSSPRHILELGTGMAGLAAIALGLRLVQLDHENFQTKVHVTLTDGHPDGVINNRVNQTLTQLSTLEDTSHPYHALEISEQMLLWTTELESPSISSLQDVVLVSDCAHFQEFHAALAITALRSLKNGGWAIFCQPHRGDSLNNFCALLHTQNVTGLVTVTWWNHAVLTDQDAKSLEQYPGVYNADLHCPKILLIEKLRDLTEDDCRKFVYHQETRR